MIPKWLYTSFFINFHYNFDLAIPYDNEENYWLIEARKVDLLLTHAQGPTFYRTYRMMTETKWVKVAYELSNNLHILW